MKRVYLPDNLETAPVEIGISADKVDDIIEKARMFDVKEEVSDPDSGSNATDDGMRDVLEDLAADPTLQELLEMIRNLDEDEQIHLVALAWVGRGTYRASQWNEALRQATAAHNSRTAEYLAGLPLLGDYLEERRSPRMRTSSPSRNRADSRTNEWQSPKPYSFRPAVCFFRRSVPGAGFCRAKALPSSPCGAISCKSA